MNKKKIREGAIESRDSPAHKRPWMKGKREVPPRLPNGSTYFVSYSATRESWSGALVVAGKEYAGEARSVYGLLNKLDRKYRKAVAGDGK